MPHKQIKAKVAECMMTFIFEITTNSLLNDDIRFIASIRKPNDVKQGANAKIFESHKFLVMLLGVVVFKWLTS